MISRVAGKSAMKCKEATLDMKPSSTANSNNRLNELSNILLFEVLNDPTRLLLRVMESQFE